MAAEICICVATHRRPQQLQRLLTSLVEQDGAPAFDVVVVDNDANRSAELVVAGFKDRLSLTYLVEPVRGLARVRNRSVAASTSKFLGIIDDDHCASPRWLASHYETATKTNAAAVIGQTDFLFEDGVPDFIRACEHFKKRSYADGDTIPWYHATTANCFLRRDALPHPTSPFSASFDLTGGEDVDLFWRMIDNGAHVIAAAHARTYSYHPGTRANLYWVVRRAFRNGGTIVEIEWRPFDWRQRAFRSVEAGVRGARNAAKAGWLWRRDKPTAIQHLLWACLDLGTVLRQFGIRIKEYRHHH